jgi:hypothetical protein
MMMRDAAHKSLQHCLDELDTDTTDATRLLRQICLSMYVWSAVAVPDFPSVPPEMQAEGSLKGTVTRLTGTYSRRDGRKQPRDPDQDPAVRWLLEAGVELLSERFLLAAGSDEARAYLSYNEIMGTLGAVNVLNACKTVIKQHGLDAGEIKSRARITRLWEIMSEYQADLLAYVFRVTARNPHKDQIRLQIPGLFQLPFGELVEVLARSETETVRSDRLMTLQAALQVSLPFDRDVQRLSAAVYQAEVDFWSETYQTIASAYGVSLNSDYSWRDVAMLLNIAVEGAGMRVIAGQKAIALESGRHVVAEMIRLMLPGLLGRSWAELATLMTR